MYDGRRPHVERADAEPREQHEPDRHHRRADDRERPCSARSGVISWPLAIEVTSTPSHHRRQLEARPGRALRP